MSPLDNTTAYYDSGEDLTGHAAAAITLARFLAVSAVKQPASQGLAPTSIGGNVPVTHVGVIGARSIGVSDESAAINTKVGILRGHKVVPVEAGAALAAGDPVMSDATGRAIPWVTAAGEANVRLGIVLNAPTAAGQAAIVALNL